VKVIVKIEGREAIPVRAIPLLTDGNTMSADSVVKAFAGNSFYYKFGNVLTYRIENGIATPIEKRWWRDKASVQMEAVEGELKRQQAQGLLSQEKAFAQWETESLQALPPGVFVWKDEFEPRHLSRHSIHNLTMLKREAVFRVINQETGEPDYDSSILDPKFDELVMEEAEQQERVKLNYNPFIPDSKTQQLVMEGFMPEVIDTSPKEGATPAPVENDNDGLTPLPAVLNWKMRIQIEASAHCLRLRQSGANPTRNSILEWITQWCRDNDVKTDGKIFPTANYLRTHVLGGRHWDVPN
jgi:hypothetical protein